jgi:Replication-relaxation
MTLGESQSVQLQDRDIAVLRGLLDSRLMTLAQVSAIYFDGRAQMAKKRIQKLKAAGCIGERKRKVNEPSVLFLARQGFSILENGDHLDGFPSITWTSLEKRLHVSDATVRHELDVVDVKAAFAQALRSTPNYSLAEFSTWPLLFQFKAAHDGGAPVLVKPDAFLRIHEKEHDALFEHTFFVEVDRSTETIETLHLKALRYLDYYRRGGLALKAGRPRSEYKDFPFRVLMIFKTEERRDNVASKLLTGHPPILTLVWLTTINDFRAEPLGTVWIRPKDWNSPNWQTPRGQTEDKQQSYRRLFENSQ